MYYTELGKSNISEGPTKRLAKNERKHAVIRMALFSTPLGTLCTMILVGMYIAGIIMKNSPIYTCVNLNSSTRMAKTGDWKSYKK